MGPVPALNTFVALARDASKPGWWHSCDDLLPPWFRTAVGLEESASLIRAYEPQVVPGLLQTEGYIRAITVASCPPPWMISPNGPWLSSSPASVA